MEVSLINTNGDSATIVLEGAMLSQINAMRRAVMNSVRTIAIDDVVIYKNTSSMYDEVLASRLGLIPIKSFPELDNGKRTFSFKLKERGPKAVHASDIKCADDRVVPVYPSMLIIELKEGEGVDLEATASFGDGSEHIKFSPAHVTYHFYPKITITKDKVKGASKIASLCPVDILSGEEEKLEVKKGKLQDCILCNACEDYAGQEIIKIDSEDDKVVMNIETWGQLSIKEILDSAISKLQEELEVIEKETT
ncbi:DNA-directed RNA polymerase subunit D [Candidatus Parvarchaeota archaeon]|nr:DNA-directed RNA polymerase subunit D [Candidatus Parvarchaeota archaeon]